MHSNFSFTDESIGKNAIIFEADMSSSVHVDDKNKDILTLGEGPTQDTTLTVEDTYPINFTQPRKSILLILHFNRSFSSLFADAAKIYQFK